LGSFVYFMLVRFVGGLTGRGSVSQLQLENVVLRHQVRVLRRSVRRPELRDRDRAFLAAASRALSRDHWASFMATPQTLIRWHRELIRWKWDPPSARTRAAGPAPRRTGSTWSDFIRAQFLTPAASVLLRIFELRRRVGVGLFRDAPSTALKSSDLPP
jgi:hypothetical protein